jgi:hypothetical protein
MYVESVLGGGASGYGGEFKINSNLCVREREAVRYVDSSLHFEG